MAMNVAAPPKHLIASLYGVTRQRVHQLEKKHGAEVVMDPDKLFFEALKHRSSKLRDLLALPTTRDFIRKTLTGKL